MLAKRLMLLILAVGADVPANRPERAFTRRRRANASRTAAPGARLGAVAPASVGISAERLDRLHQGMQGFVDRKEVERHRHAGGA